MSKEKAIHFFNGIVSKERIENIYENINMEFKEDEIILDDIYIQNNNYKVSNEIKKECDLILKELNLKQYQGIRSEKSKFM